MVGSWAYALALRKIGWELNPSVTGVRGKHSNMLRREPVNTLQYNKSKKGTRVHARAHTTRHTTV